MELLDISPFFPIFATYFVVRCCRKWVLNNINEK